MGVIAILSAGITGTLLGPALRAIICAYSDPARGSPRRRCSSRRQRVGPPPGSIEIITGAVFVGLALRLDSVPLLIGLCWLAAFSVTLAVIDTSTQRLPNPLVGGALIGLLAALTVTALTNHQLTDLFGAVLGGTTVFVGYTD